MVDKDLTPIGYYVIGIDLANGPDMTAMTPRVKPINQMLIDVQVNIGVALDINKIAEEISAVIDKDKPKGNTGYASVTT